MEGRDEGEGMREGSEGRGEEGRCRGGMKEGNEGERE